MKEIRTARLLLRPFAESDYDDLYEFLSQLKDDEFEGYPGITYENGREHLRYRLGSEEFYAVELSGSGKVIGNIYCGSRDYGTKEVGYIINRDYRRQGYAAEALSAVMENAFREGAHRIYAECDPRNAASWRLLEKVGMRREAHFRQNIWFHKDESGAPVWKDTYVYARLNGESPGAAGGTGENSKASIRKIGPDGAPECVRVIRDSFMTVAREFGLSPENAPAYTAFSVSEEKIESRMKEQGRVLYGCYEDGRLIGCCNLLRQSADACELGSLCVLPAYRRRGIGTLLLNEALLRAEEAGCRVVKLSIIEENAALRRWYEKRGFVHTGTKKYDFFPFTCGYMEKTIRSAPGGEAAENGTGK